MVPALIVHGGAGGDPDDKPTYREALGEALARGWAVLRRGGAALDAIEATIQALEDHPRLNAGYGSALTERGTVECDASIMEGDALQAGAVGAVSGVRSAIGLARRILEDGRHILLVGDGALTFARDQGLPLCPPDALATDRQRQSLAKHLAARQGAGAPHASGAVGGTVGAVAIDVHGCIVAGTSTGGYTGKRPGRVGRLRPDRRRHLRRQPARRRVDDGARRGVHPHGARQDRARHPEGAGRSPAGRGGLPRRRPGGRPRGRRPDPHGLAGAPAYAHSTAFMPVGWCLPTAAEPILPF